MDLKQTESGVYYIHDYYPSKRYPRVTQEQEDIRSLIWVYKDLHEAAMRKFTNELMEAISLISQDIRSSKIGLVAVPPSKRYKISPIRVSIGIFTIGMRGILRSSSLAVIRPFTIMGIF